MKRSLTRRQLAKAAVAGSALAPLAHSDVIVPKAEFDPVHWTLESYKSAPLKLTFGAANKSQAEAWQRQLRAKLTELLGGFPQERTALVPQIVETREFPGYVREKFVFTSQPGVASSRAARIVTSTFGTAPTASISADFKARGSAVWRSVLTAGFSPGPSVMRK